MKRGRLNKGFGTQRCQDRDADVYNFAYRVDNLNCSPDEISQEMIIRGEEERASAEPSGTPRYLMT